MRTFRGGYCQRCSDEICHDNTSDCLVTVVASSYHLWVQIFLL